jgi:hypothetical protein
MAGALHRKFLSRIFFILCYLDPFVLSVRSSSPHVRSLIFSPPKPPAPRAERKTGGLRTLSPSSAAASPLHQVHPAWNSAVNTIFHGEPYKSEDDEEDDDDVVEILQDSANDDVLETDAKVGADDEIEIVETGAVEEPAVVQATASCNGGVTSRSNSCELPHASYAPAAVNAEPVVVIAAGGTTGWPVVLTPVPPPPHLQHRVQAARTTSQSANSPALTSSVGVPSGTAAERAASSTDEVAPASPPSLTATPGGPIIIPRKYRMRLRLSPTSQKKAVQPPPLVQEVEEEEVVVQDRGKKITRSSPRKLQSSPKVCMVLSFCCIV